jgi:hypothetical protein
VKQYKILDTIYLGFLTHNDSYELFIDPGFGHLKFDGSDIVYIDAHGGEHVSHTTNNAIDIWLEQGKIEVM